LQLRNFFECGYVEFRFTTSLNLEQREARDYLGPVYLRFYPSMRHGGKFWASNDYVSKAFRSFGDAFQLGELMKKIAFNRDVIDKKLNYEKFPHEAWIVLAGIIPSNTVMEFSFFQV
jgi:hypothetical protein